MFYAVLQKKKKFKFIRKIQISGFILCKYLNKLNFTALNFQNIIHRGTQKFLSMQNLKMHRWYKNYIIYRTVCRGEIKLINESLYRDTLIVRLYKLVERYLPYLRVMLHLWEKYYLYVVWYIFFRNFFFTCI